MRTIIIIGVMVAGLLAGRVARADDEEDRKAEARAHYEKGRKFFEAGAYASAIEEFEAAYKAVPNPKLLIALGSAYREKKDREKALKYYRMYLDKVSTGPDAEIARKAIKEIEEEMKPPTPPPTPPVPAAKPITPPPAPVVSKPAPPPAPIVTKPTPPPPPVVTKPTPPPPPVVTKPITPRPVPVVTKPTPPVETTKPEKPAPISTPPVATVPKPQPAITPPVSPTPPPVVATRPATEQRPPATRPELKPLPTEPEQKTTELKPLFSEQPPVSTERPAVQKEPPDTPPPVSNRGRTLRIIGITGLVLGAALAGTAIYTWRAYSGLEADAHNALVEIANDPNYRRYYEDQREFFKNPDSSSCKLPPPTMTGIIPPSTGAGSVGARYADACTGANNYAAATTGLWIGAGVLAAAGTVALVLGFRKPAVEKARTTSHFSPRLQSIAPVLTGRDFGFALTGSF